MYYYGPNYGYENGYAYAYPSRQEHNYIGVFAVILIIFLILIIFSSYNKDSYNSCL